MLIYTKYNFEPRLALHPVHDKTHPFNVAATPHLQRPHDLLVTCYVPRTRRRTGCIGRIGAYARRVFRVLAFIFYLVTI